MKTSILTVGMLLFTFLINAQEKISEYELAMYKDKVFEIQAGEPDKNENFSFYIDVPPASDTRMVSLIVERKELEDFKKVLNQARDVYVDWKLKAVENKVEDVNKEIETDKLRIKAAFVYGSNWNFDYSVKPEMNFRVLKGIPYLVFTHKNKLQSSSNRYIDSNGFVMIFSSEEEIDDFLDKLTVEKVEQFFAEKESKEDIFKQ